MRTGPQMKLEYQAGGLFGVRNTSTAVCILIYGDHGVYGRAKGPPAALAWPRGSLVNACAAWKRS